VTVPVARPARRPLTLRPDSWARAPLLRHLLCKCLHFLTEDVQLVVRPVASLADFAYCCIDPFTDQLNLACSRSHLPLLCAKMVFTLLEAGAGAGPDAKVHALRHLSVEQMSVEQMSVEQMSVEQKRSA